MNCYSQNLFCDLIGQLLLMYCTAKQFMVLYILLYRLIGLLSQSYDMYC